MGLDSVALEGCGRVSAMALLVPCIPDGKRVVRHVFDEPDLPIFLCVKEGVSKGMAILQGIPFFSQFATEEVVPADISLSLA